MIMHEFSKETEIKTSLLKKVWAMWVVMSIHSHSSAILQSSFPLNTPFQTSVSPVAEPVANLLDADLSFLSKLSLLFVVWIW